MPKAKKAAQIEETTETIAQPIDQIAEHKRKVFEAVVNNLLEWRSVLRRKEAKLVALRKNSAGAEKIAEAEEAVELAETEYARSYKQASKKEVDEMERRWQSKMKTFITGVVEIPVADISVSQFDPQILRRKKFTNEELSELASSIKEQGLISPITVRPVKEKSGKYEVICGERRYLASMVAGFTSILAVVRELSDEAALEIQFQENLQRKDIDPLDEAYSYQYLLDHSNMTVTDLAIKFGKPEKFIAQRLKLNLLIPEVLEDVAAGVLHLGHALEISKLAPEVQKQALNFCYESIWDNGKYVPDKSKIKTLNDFRARIQREIFLSLKEAVFSTRATNLRPDGLPCVKCPERTGAKGSLFEELHESKNDRCLNLVCFTGKSVRFVQNKRAELSAESVAAGKPADYKIPIISWYNSNLDAIVENFGARPLVDGEYKNLWDSECEFKEIGIFVDKSRFGETINICRSGECPQHGRSLKQTDNASGTGEKSRAEKEAFYKRKQEIFDVKVGEAVRLKVLAEAAKTFTADKWVFDDEKWRILLLARLWSRVDENARAAIHEALGKPKYSIENHFRSEKTILEYFTTKLTADERSKMLFLCIVANEGEMLYGSWNSQDRVKAVAEEFGVDYQKLDAAERLLKSPKKYMSQAQDYFNKVETGEKAEKPIFYKLES
jgi:ParB/RepB/Spo0J family partition protein